MKTLLLLVLAAAGASATPILYTIGADPLGVPNQLVMIDVAAQSTTTLTTLGAGNTAYLGGLAYTTTDGTRARFLGIESDSFGNASIRDFWSDGAFNPDNSAIGQGSFGGLVDDGNHSYVRNDFLGASSLETDPAAAVIALGFGFNGGLANTPGGLYLIGNDSFGNSSFYWYDPGAQTPVLQSIALGAGFYGGLAYDSGSTRFYAIQNNGFGGSILWSFLATDAAPTFEFDMNGAYGFSSLTAGSTAAANPVPEPATSALLAAGLGLLALRRRR